MDDEIERLVDDVILQTKRWMQADQFGDVVILEDASHKQTKALAALLARFSELEQENAALRAALAKSKLAVSGRVAVIETLKAEIEDLRDELAALRVKPDPQP